MTLKNFAVVILDPWKDGIAVEYWDDLDRCIAAFQLTMLDAAFDHLLQLGPPHRRLYPHEWNILVEENLPAFGRIISTRHTRDAASASKPARRVEIDLADIEGSGERFTRNALPINTGKDWSTEDLDYLAHELRRRTPLLEVARYLKRDVVEVEIRGDRMEFPD